MSEQHTPGPWLVTTSDNSFTIGPDDRYHGIIVARNQFAGYEEKDGWRREKRETILNAEANARLIAGPPDLLRALSELMEQIECLGGIEYSRDVEPYKAEACWDDAIRRAQSAIAKATSAKIIEFPATALDELAGAGGTK